MDDMIRRLDDALRDLETMKEEARCLLIESLRGAMAQDDTLKERLRRELFGDELQ